MLLPRTALGALLVLSLLSSPADAGEPRIGHAAATTMVVGPKTITVCPILFDGIVVDGAREVTIEQAGRVTTRQIGELPPSHALLPAQDFPFERWSDAERWLTSVGVPPSKWEAAPGWPSLRWIQTSEESSFSGTTGESWRLAQLHEVHLTETNEEWALWIAPESGELLERRELVRFGAFEGEVLARIPAENLPYSATAPTVTVPLADLTVIAAGNPPVLTDAAGQFSVTAPGTSLIASAALTGAFLDVQNQGGPDAMELAPLALGTLTTIEFGDPASEFSTAEANAYAIPSAARRWLLEISPGLAAAQASVIVHVNIAGSCYAAYLPIFQVIQLTRAGGGCANAAYGTLLAHEYFHHIQEQLPFTPELEVEEANADIFAAYFLEDPRIGWNYAVANESIRDLSQPSVYPVPSNVPQETGLPLAAAFWDLRSELIDELGASAGAQAAHELWLTWVFAGDGILDPGTLEELLILDDDDGDLSNGTPHSSALLAAFPPHGLDLPLEPVTGVTCAAIEQTVALTWTLPTLGTQDAIEIHRDGVVLATLPPDATEYVDPLHPAGFHEWVVVTRLGPAAAPSSACPLTLPPVFPFVRGDVTGNGSLDLSDGITLLTYMFAGGPTLTCLDAADFNDNGTVDLSDALNLLSYMFSSGAPPVAPFPNSDYDPTPDTLLCS